MKYKFLNKLNLKELEELNLVINNPNNIDDLVVELNEIKKLKENNPNNLICLDQRWFSQDSYKLLVDNGIVTVDDLVNCDVSALKGIDAITSEEINWGKKFYDFSNVTYNEKECKKLKK